MTQAKQYYQLNLLVLEHHKKLDQQMASLTEIKNYETTTLLDAIDPLNQRIHDTHELLFRIADKIETIEKVEFDVVTANDNKRRIELVTEAMVNFERNFHTGDFRPDAILNLTEQIKRALTPELTQT